MHAIAHEGCTDTVGESALKAGWGEGGEGGGENPLPHRDSNLPQRRAGPTLYRLSFIPAETSFPQMTHVIQLQQKVKAKNRSSPRELSTKHASVSHRWPIRP